MISGEPGERRLDVNFHSVGGASGNVNLPLGDLGVIAPAGGADEARSRAAWQQGLRPTRHPLSASPVAFEPFLP
jgi:hypothetical protein